MAVPEVAGQYFPTVEELVNIGLRNVAGAAARRGLTVNVLPGSELWMRFNAIARQVVGIYANNKLGLAASSPQDATEDDLPALAAQFGVVARPAQAASGFVTIKVVTGTVTIPVGFECTASNGVTYEVTQNYLGLANGADVEIVARTGGAHTNLSAGETVNWTAASLGNLKRDATVESGGVEDGTDGDSVEVVRQRLLKRLSRAAVGGNWAAIAEWAEGASSAIADAYVYPAIQGPGSYGVALVSADGDRTVTDAVVNAAATAITAEVPGRANGNITTVLPQEVDVVFAVSAEAPKYAGGKGNGFRDGSPWPNDTSGAVKVTAYNSGTGTITVNTASLGVLAPNHHIGIWDPDSETMYEYTVLTATDAGATVDITVIGGFSLDHTGAYVSAGAVNLRTWAANALAAMRTLGPGEKSSSTWVLPRARRRPTPDVQGPMKLTSRICSAISDASPEILGIEYSNRYATGTTSTLTAPTVPVASTDPPNILVLKHLAFRATT